jgi:hypothetical protein
MSETLINERAARIEALADAIIADAKAREAERHRHNEGEMEKLRRWLVSKSKRETPGLTRYSAKPSPTFYMRKSETFCVRGVQSCWRVKLSTATRNSWTNGVRKFPTSK